MLLFFFKWTNVLRTFLNFRIVETNKNVTWNYQKDCLFPIPFLSFQWDCLYEEFDTRKKKMKQQSRKKWNEIKNLFSLQWTCWLFENKEVFRKNSLCRQTKYIAHQMKENQTGNKKHRASTKKKILHFRIQWTKWWMRLSFSPSVATIPRTIIMRS